MNLVALHHTKLDYFGDDKILVVRLLLAVQRNGDEELKGLLSECLHRIDGSSIAHEKTILIEYLKRVAYKMDRPNVIRVNQGEDFCLEVTLEPGRDFSGFNLTIRHVLDMALLSANDVVGRHYDEAPVQAATVGGLALAAGGFYKVQMLLEHSSSGIATGNGSAVLTDALLIVDNSIDA